MNMLKAFGVIVGALGIFHFAHARSNIETVPFVEPAKYLGDWYQIAHVPLFFEGGHCDCARQRLTLTGAADTIGVYNSCNVKSATGKLRDIRGTAINKDPQSNAKWAVNFGLPWKGSYWIVGLDPDYRYAVVTDKYGYSLYILSKTPMLERALYDEAIAIATRKNLRVDKLRVTNQQGCTYPQ